MAAAITLSAGAAVLAAGCLLPWLRSGARDRSSFEVFALVDRLGVLPSGVLGLGLRLWPLVPVLLLASTYVTWWRGGWWPVIPAATTAVYATWVAVAMLRLDTPSIVSVQSVGPVVAVAGAALLVVGAVIGAIAPERSARRAARRAGRS